MVHLKKFAVKPDWTSVKLDVAVEMPDILDLSFLRGQGLQSTETLLPEATTAPPTIVYDQSLLRQLSEMGFPPEACKRALYFTENGSVEAASTWLMEHISDEDFSSPFVPPGVDAGFGKGKVPKREILSIHLFYNKGYFFLFINFSRSFCTRSSCYGNCYEYGFH